MNKRTIKTFTILTIFALICLISLQALWLRNSFKKEKENYQKLISYAVYLIDGKILNYMAPDYMLEELIDPISENIPEKKINNESRKLAASKLLGYYYFEGDSLPLYAPQFRKDYILNHEADSIISEVVQYLKIQKDYVFEIFDQNLNAGKLEDNNRFSEYEKNQIYEIRILNPEYSKLKQKIKIYFSDGNFQILKRMGLILVGNILLMILITGAFIYAFRIILSQKKIYEMRKDFISNLTHEFKTPVSTISLTIEGLLKFDIKKNPDKLDEYLNIAQKENKRLGLMIEKILNIAAFERGKLKMKPTDVHIHKIISETVRNFDVHVKHRNGAIITELNSAIDVVVGDNEHLIQVIFNLLDNANKYSPESPEILISTRQIITEKMIEIRITDNGIGIPQEQLENIFMPFIRANEKKGRNIKGFGLGLSYVSEVIKFHNGNINVYSKPVEGSSFIIKLPLK